MSPLQQWEVVPRQNSAATNPSSIVFPSIDEHTEDHRTTSGCMILERSICARKYCYRLVRNQDHRRQVLCDDHKMDLAIAVADMFCDWFHKDTPAGITPSSSIRMAASRLTIQRNWRSNKSSSQIWPSQQSRTYQTQPHALQRSQPRSERSRERTLSTRAPQSPSIYSARLAENDQTENRSELAETCDHPQTNRSADDHDAWLLRYGKGGPDLHRAYQTQSTVTLKQSRN